MRLLATRSDYYEAALAVLAETGHGGMKIGVLCNAVGTTTGSFYHYFGSLEGFVRELLAHWQNEQTQQVVVLSANTPDPRERVRLLRKRALELPHDAETAIRAWSHVNPIVEDVQRRVDEERLDALRNVIGGLVSDAAQADLLARMGMTMLVGAQQWRTPVDVDELDRLLDVYERTILAAAG